MLVCRSVSFCRAEEGPESGGGGEGGTRRLHATSSEDGGGEQGKEVRRLKIPKPLEKAERRRREGASELEKWKGMGSRRVRVLDKRQAGGGATFKRKHINREFEFQSSSKMMSFSQKCHSIITNQLKKKKKKQPKRKRKLLVFVWW